MKAFFDALEPGGTDWALAKQFDRRRLPAHIAIIMDGNGRWAKRRNLPRVAGHRAGAEAVRVTVETCVCNLSALDEAYLLPCLPDIIVAHFLAKNSWACFTEK